MTAIVLLNGEWVGLLVCLPPLVSYGCLLVGNRLRRPAPYWPWLLVNLALVMGAFIVAGVCYLFGAAFISHNFSIGSSVFETFLGTASVLTAIGVSAFALAAFYYFYIVYRDYKYVKAKSELVEPKKRLTRQRRLYVQPTPSAAAATAATAAAAAAARRSPQRQRRARSMEKLATTTAAAAAADSNDRNASSNQRRFDDQREADDFATSADRWRSADTLPLLAHEPHSPHQRHHSSPFHLPASSGGGSSGGAMTRSESLWQVTSV